MQPYNADNHFSRFQCRAYPRCTPSLSYSQPYEPQFQTQPQAKKPFRSPFSIESLLGRETSHELSAFSSPSAKRYTSTSMTTKLKELENRRPKNNSTSDQHNLDEQTSASTSGKLQAYSKQVEVIDLFSCTCLG